MNNKRITRINDEILKEAAGIIRQELKDPRLSSMISVVKAETTPDLKFCKIFVSVMGEEEAKKEALVGLKNAAGFIRRQLAERINLRNTPELQFVLDDSIDYGYRIMKLIKEANKSSGSEEQE